MKKPPPDGMSHTGGGGAGIAAGETCVFQIGAAISPPFFFWGAIRAISCPRVGS